MVTAIKKKTKKKVLKKATKKNVVNKVVTNKVNITLGQVKTIAAFYEKNNKKVPAFLAKNL